MARIVIDARKLRSSTGRYVRNMLSQLEKLDTTNEYIVIGNPEDFDKNEPSSWQPTAKNFSTLSTRTKPYGFAEQLWLPFLLYKTRADLVHFTMPQQPFLYFKTKVTAILDLNLVYADKSFSDKKFFRFKQQVFKVLLHYVARTSKHVLTISEYSMQDIVDYTHINPNKITVTYCAAEKFDAKPAAHHQLAGKQFIMYVGQSSPYKGQRQLIQAHQLLLETHPHLYLAIGGKPDKFTKATERWVAENDYKNVLFLGFVTDGELAWMYQHTACYVCPSRNEGFGLLNLEAMVYGAPVASSNATCLPEVSGDAALYFDPLNICEMARVIDTILSDKKTTKELNTKGAKQHKKYSWKLMAQQTHAVYLEALKR